MNRYEYVKKSFNDIIALEGVDELKEAALRLFQFHQNKNKYSVSEASLPNYLWVAKRGGGVTTCLNAFVELLYATGLIEFNGIVKYFEFIPAYLPPNVYFSELTRLNNTISEIAGHHRYFKGVACIIIDEWLENLGESNFCNLLDYIENKNDKILFIFCTHTDNKRTIESIESSLSAYLRFDKVELRFPGTGELLKYIEAKYFAKHGFSFTKDALSLLSETIDDISTGKHFNGFKTITQMTDDILYDLLSSDSMSRNITAEMLSKFAKNSAYTTRIKSSSDRSISIGFLSTNKER